MQAYRTLTSAKAALKRSWRSLALFLTITLAVACLGALITEPALVDWYTNLQKPIFTPPGWAFGAAWAFNYSSMAIAFWRVWLKRKQTKILAAALLYHLQLLLNLLWIVAFFGMHNPGLAFGDIILLQIANIATAICFFEIDNLSGYILTPYLCWVSFASVLNSYIWIINC
jgi:translocator protein